MCSCEVRLTQGSGSASEADGLQVTKQRMHSQRVGPDRPSNGQSNPHHTRRDVPASKRFLALYPFMHA